MNNKSKGYPSCVIIASITVALFLLACISSFWLESPLTLLAPNWSIRAKQRDNENDTKCLSPDGCGGNLRSKEEVDVPSAMSTTLILMTERTQGENAAGKDVHIPSATPTLMSNGKHGGNVTEIPQVNCSFSGDCQKWPYLMATDARMRLARQEQLVVNLMHIPKTGGTSLYNEARKPTRTFSKYFSFQKSSPGTDEVCFLNLKDEEFPIATIFRSPHSQTLSQFLECKYDLWGQHVIRFTSFPRGKTEDFVKGVTPDFDAWLDHFIAAPSTRNYFRCYHPKNFQTRYLYGKEKHNHHGSICHGPTYEPFPRSKGRTQKIINELWYIGLTEDMELSICLFEFQITGAVSDRCLCNYKTSKESVGQPAITHITHNVPRHHVSALSEATLQKIDLLTNEDVFTYNHARKIFYEKVNLAQTYLNTCLKGFGDLSDSEKLKLLQ
mmetsp:Transcript_858/g.1971  ORF Transcript_858/g.1971 Transcript_858/m.1971 type:complete len:440 (-) Transcript_858:34-1353(-)